MEFKTITKVQQRKVEKKNTKKEPSVLFSPLRYPSSLKNKMTFLYSPVIKIKLNKIHLKIK